MRIERREGQGLKTAFQSGSRAAYLRSFVIGSHCDTIGTVGVVNKVGAS